MNTKSLFVSKTFWANVLGGVVSVAGLASKTIAPEYAPYIVAAGAIANVLLRLITNQGVTVG